MKTKSTFLVQKALASPALVHGRPHGEAPVLSMPVHSGNLSLNKLVIRGMSARGSGANHGGEQMTDFDIARANMVESQVRPNGITDHRIIAAMAMISRENFVPAGRRQIAYVDDDLEIANGRYLTEPMVFARLVQLADGGRLVAVVGEGEAAKASMWTVKGKARGVKGGIRCRDSGASRIR